MEWTDQKQRFESLNAYVVLPTDKKEQIRQRLHAEIERKFAEDDSVSQVTAESSTRKKSLGSRSKRSTGSTQNRKLSRFLSGSGVAAVVAAAACIAIGVQLTGHRGTESGLAHRSAMGSASATSSSGSSSASGISSSTSSAAQFGSAAGSSTVNGPASTTQSMWATPKTLNASAPFELYGTYGWVLSGNTLLHSEDGGASWQAVKVPFQGKPYSQSVTAVNGLVAFWAVGQVGQTSGSITVYRTEDGGHTWQSTNVRENLPGSSAGQVPKSIVFATPTDGFMLTDIPLLGMGGTMPGGVYRTTNGGETWIRLTPTGFKAGLVPFPWLSFQSGQVGWTEAAPQIGADAGVTDGHYTLYRTQDAGQTWTPVQLGSQSSDSSSGKVDYGAPVWGASAGYMTCVRTDAKGQRQLTLYRITGTGANWTEIHAFGFDNPAGADNSVGPTVAAFGNTVWVEWNGTLWMSGDAGQTWLSSTKSFERVTELEPSGQESGYVVSMPTSGDLSQLTVYRTSDGGATWTTVPVH